MAMDCAANTLYTGCSPLRFPLTSGILPSPGALPADGDTLFDVTTLRKLRYRKSVAHTPRESTCAIASTSPGIPSSSAFLVAPGEAGSYRSPVANGCPPCCRETAMYRSLLVARRSPCACVPSPPRIPRFDLGISLGSKTSLRTLWRPFPCQNPRSWRNASAPAACPRKTRSASASRRKREALRRKRTA